jgi:hypothetical protein
MFINQRFLYDVAPENTGGGTELTKEAIDKQNVVRNQLGQDPLPYPTGTEGAPEPQKLSQIEQFKVDKLKELTDNNPSGLTAEEINNEAEKLVQARAAEIETEQEAAKEELRQKAIKEGTTSVIKIGAKPTVEKLKEVEKEKKLENDEPEVDDEILLKQLSKKAGKEIKSLEEFLNPKIDLTPEAKETQLQERESAKVAFALQNKIISKKEIEDFIADTKDLRSVAFDFYTQQQLALDDTLTDKQIEDAFEDRFNTDADKESKEYKAGQQEINFIANSIISKKHSKYLNLETVFSEYENEQIQTSQRQQKILQLAPSYKKDVDAVIGSIAKIKIGSHEVELDEELLAGYKSQMLDPKYSEVLISRGWTLQELETATQKHVVYENLESIVDGILASEKLKYQAGQRGIIPPKNTTAKVLDEKQTDARKQLQTDLGMQTN